MQIKVCTWSLSLLSIALEEKFKVSLNLAVKGAPFLTDVEEGCPCSEEVCRALKGSGVSSLVLSRTCCMNCGSFHSVPAFLRSPSCGWSGWKRFQRRKKILKTPSKWNQLVVDARKAMRWPLSEFLKVGLRGGGERWERERSRVGVLLGSPHSDSPKGPLF